MTRFAQIIIASSLLLFSPIVLHAQGISIQDQDLDGQSIKLGETDLVPSLRIEFDSTDNIFRSDGNELDGDRVIINPELNWFADRRLLSLRAKYEGNYAISSDDALSFTDHLLGFTADAEFNSKNRSRGSAAIEFGHDDIGIGVLSNATADNADDVAEFTNINLVGTHTYGANAARGNIIGGLRIESEDFQSQALFTSGRSYVRIEPFARFSYRVSADTRLILGAQLSNFSFDNETLDRFDTTLFTGANFSATGKLSGIFRIGATQSSFSSELRDDETSLFLDTQLSYKPTNFAELTLNLRRVVDNNRGNLSGFESAIDTTISVGWNHEWSSRISTQASIEVEDFDATCPQLSDTVTTPSFEIEFALRRWISFGLNASQESRSVSNCNGLVAATNSLEEYDRVDFGAFIKGTL